MSYSTKHYRGDAKKTAMTPAEVAARAAEAIRPSEATLAYAAQLASGNMAQAAEDPSSVIDSEVLTSLIDDDQVEEDLAFEANLKRQLAAGAVTQEQAKVMLAERQRAANLKFDAALEKALRDKKITKTEALAIKREKTRGIAQVKATARGADKTVEATERASAKAIEATNAAARAINKKLGKTTAFLGEKSGDVEKAVRDAIDEVIETKDAVQNAVGAIESTGTDTKAALGAVNDRLLAAERGNNRRHGELMQTENLGGLGQKIAEMREELRKRDFDAAMARAKTPQERAAVIAAAAADDEDVGDDPVGADARSDESDLYEGMKNFAGRVASMFTPKTPRTLVSELSAGTPGQEDDDDEEDDGGARAAPAPTSKIPKLRPAASGPQIIPLGPDGKPAGSLWKDAGGVTTSKGVVSSKNDEPAKMFKALLKAGVVSGADTNYESFYVKGFPEGGSGSVVGRRSMLAAIKQMRGADLKLPPDAGLAGFLANHSGAMAFKAKGGGLEESQDEPKKKETHRVGRPSNRPDPSARREIAMALLEQAETDVEGARRMFLALRQKDVFPNQELSGLATEIGQIHTRLHHQAGHKGKPRPLRLRMPLEKIQQLEPDLELPAL